MNSEYDRLQTQISHLQTELKKYPDGHLICSKNQSRCKWYQSDGHNKVYIPKSNRHLAEQLSVKKYLSLLLEDLKNEQRAIEFYLRHHKTNVGRAEKLLTDTSEYQNLLKPYFTPLSQELSDWIHAPYEHNLLYPEQLIHKSISGNLLRSKSEAIIDMLLFVNKIPFRYECSLVLGEVTLYPDFTIRHPHNGTTFYWEHFGLIDNASYSANAFSKLQLYATHKIYPSIQLITTYETKEHPLTTDTVEKIISDFFL